MIKMQFKLKESSNNETMKNYNSRAAQILALRSIDQKGHQCKKTNAVKNHRLQDLPTKLRNLNPTVTQSLHNH